MAEMTVEQLTDRLKSIRTNLVRAIEGLSDDDIAREVGTDGWRSIKDIILHLSTSEHGMLVVAKRCLAGKMVSYEGFDLDRWNERQVEKKRHLSVSQALAELQAVREDGLNTLQGLTPEQLRTPAAHPFWGDVTVGQLFRIMSIHDELHRRDIEQLRTMMNQ